MHHARPDPVPHLLLGRVQDVAHGLGDPRRLLHALQALARVAELVAVVRVQQVLLAQAPEAEHVVRDLAPEGERLQHEVVLLLVAVREPRAVHAAADGQVVPGFHPVRPEECGEVLHHLVDGVAVGGEEAVVVADGVEALLDLVLRDAARGVLLPEDLDGAVLLFALAVERHARLDTVGDDLARGRGDEVVLQNFERAALLQEPVHGADGPHRRHVQELLHLPAHRVLQQIHELAVLPAHLLGVHDLVPPPDLEQRLEHRLVVLVVVLRGQVLPLAVVERHHQRRQHRAYLVQLGVGALGLAHLARVDTVRVGADRDDGLKQAQHLALLERESHGDVLGALQEPGPRRRARRRRVAREILHLLVRVLGAAAARPDGPRGVRGALPLAVLHLEAHPAVVVLAGQTAQRGALVLALHAEALRSGLRHHAPGVCVCLA
mmetsp:Transcript_9904/g.28481  ORF Transcript_9904/g.28481 Transcript_9904/m.28481 type:complete len:435 (-) Transcript_9904:430-1734(-)